MKIFLAALTLLVALSSGSWSYDVCGVRSNPGEVQGMAGNPAYFDCGKDDDDRCKGYVVLVTFRDTNAGWYAKDDQPYGYSWDLFNQFFNGGYETGVDTYTGNIVRQATGKVAETEEVFGSVRAYFNEVYGEDIVEFEILNKKNTDGSPMWLQLPSTKYAYGNLVGGDQTFWGDAEAAVRANTGNVLKSVPAGFPFKTTPVSPADTLLKNKAIYVYAGLSLGNKSSLHPRVDRVTRSSTSTGGIGARMVIGERQGWHGWGLPIGDPDKTPTKDDLIGLTQASWQPRVISIVVSNSAIAFHI